MRRCGALRIFVFGALQLLLGLRLMSQSDAATISGRITDQSGAVIPGVEGITTNSDSGIKVSVETNDSGIYVLLDLRPGNYQLTVEKSGFRRVVLTGLTLDVQDAPWWTNNSCRTRP